MDSHASHTQMRVAGTGGSSDTAASGLAAGEHVQSSSIGSSTSAAGQTSSSHTFPLSDKNNPLGVHPTPEGGVAIAGRAGLPEGHAKMSDKIIGGIDKVISAVTFDKAGVQDAKLRMAGGLAAAKGEARAPVDHL